MDRAIETEISRADLLTRCVKNGCDPYVIETLADAKKFAQTGGIFRAAVDAITDARLKMIQT